MAVVKFLIKFLGDNRGLRELLTFFKKFMIYNSTKRKLQSSNARSSRDIEDINQFSSFEDVKSNLILA